MKDTFRWSYKSARFVLRLRAHLCRLTNTIW
jgi:hypothetical protein